ncbi:UNVERIFIED_CONTAM: hypothetical protein Sangu_3045000 [Sesamum angustifolium]|uniref:Uncharacterized protein n=1 Tax=Sesamum angustifolium TaxID=2727405 RepID=A0AAW2KGZ2_9LAMI
MMPAAPARPGFPREEPSMLSLNHDEDGVLQRTMLGARRTVCRNRNPITPARCKSPFHCVLVKVRATYSVWRWRWISRIMPSVENWTPRYFAAFRCVHINHRIKNSISVRMCRSE